MNDNALPDPDVTETIRLRYDWSLLILVRKLKKKITA